MWLWDEVQEVEKVFSINDWLVGNFVFLDKEFIKGDRIVIGIK